MLATLALLPSTAEGATFRGKTSQDRRVELVQRGDDEVAKVSVRWRTKCPGTGVLITTTTVFARPLDDPSPPSIADRGRYVERFAGARVRFRVRMAAERSGSQRWKGSFRAVATAFDDGRVVDRCRSGRIGWKAARA